MMLDRASYVTTAGIVVVAVAALGIAVKHGLTHASPPVRTTYDSIFYVDLNMLVIAIIGSRIARDAQTNVSDLRASNSRLSADITERKRAEDILKASEEKYRALVETTDTGYLITDKEGKVIDANREYVRLTGHSELGEILGRSVIEWTATHEKQRNAEALARCVKDGFIRDLVIDYVDGSNRVTPVEVNAKVTGSGESLRTISLCRDVSDRKRAEEVRLQLQLAQAQKMESIGRLAGGVAHDFNNLLTVINGYAAFLSKELVVQDPLRKYAVEIGEAGKRAASLTSQLLAFSRKRAIMPKAVDVNAVVADAERMLQRLIGEDIELVSSLAPHLGLVMADPDQMHQIILNLAVNARDAMPNGGRFEITTAEVELDETAAAAHPDATPGCYVRLTVTDTGTGMTEEVQRKIFEPFFTTKGPGKGTGLGLAMVYGAVRQHDGWIEVNSKLGRGSTFQIHLPCIDAGVAADEAKLAATNAVHGDETVLVVEDQEAVRRLTKTILEEHGYRVLEAASGAEAHAVAKEHAGEIDLLLTDVVMPGMDGRTLSGQLRDLRPNLRVILMSGYAGDLTAHEGAPASGLAYIQKPFVPEELATKVRGVLDSSV
jgi:PAS domain S-box-containing protein